MCAREILLCNNSSVGVWLSTFAKKPDESMAFKNVILRENAVAMDLSSKPHPCKACVNNLCICFYFLVNPTWDVFLLGV